jgi:hypothetical protein
MGELKARIRELKAQMGKLKAQMGELKAQRGRSMTRNGELKGSIARSFCSGRFASLHDRAIKKSQHWLFVMKRLNQNQNLSRVRRRLLSRNQLLKISLGIMQHLFPAIRGLSQGWNQIPCLQSHVQLKMRNIFAEVFSNRRVRGLL